MGCFSFFDATYLGQAQEPGLRAMEEVISAAVRSIEL
jgi:hypothetical protein